MPKISDFVLVRTHPNHHQGAEIAPAIVTQVRPATQAQDATDTHGPIPAQPETINVQVFGDNTNAVSWRGGLRYVDDLKALGDDVHPYDVYTEMPPAAIPTELAK